MVGIFLQIYIFHIIQSTCTGKESVTHGLARSISLHIFIAYIIYVARSQLAIHRKSSRKNQIFVSIFLFRPADKHYGGVQTDKGGKRLFALHGSHSVPFLLV